jgi:Cof subfamily protein (haloacid dehalogenase superfamily)
MKGRMQGKCWGICFLDPLSLSFKVNYKGILVIMGKLSKTLYISDLDGTLLNNEPDLSVKTIETVNKLIDDGHLFSIATARSITSSKRFIDKLNVKLPIILHNGVFIYDLASKQYIASNYLEREAAIIIASVAKESGLNPIIFTMDHAGIPHVYYERIANHADKHFIEICLKHGDKRFRQVEDVCNFAKDEVGENVISFLIQDEHNKIVELYQNIKLSLLNSDLCSNDLPTVHISLDSYTNWYSLDITSSKSNKGDAVRALKNILGIDRVVCFGDNINDIPMFEACDERYAVVNACMELKAKADRVIGSNKDDGVAKFLIELQRNH